MNVVGDTVKVLVAEHATPEEVAAITQTFEERGVRASVRAAYGQKSMGEPWAVNLVEWTIAAFIALFAKDVYAGGKWAGGR